MTFFISYGSEVLDHLLPILRKLAPVSYDFIPRLKENMRGVRCDDLDELEVAVASAVAGIEAVEFGSRPNVTLL